MITPILSGFSKSERVGSALHIEDRNNLSEYGSDARVHHIPGHSKSSIGILTIDSNLLENADKPFP